MVRALLTDAERRAVEDDPEMSHSNKTSHLARVKRKIGRLGDDADQLRAHRPEIYEQLHESVCREDIEDRITVLETEVQQLHAILEHHDIDTDISSVNTTADENE